MSSDFGINLIESATWFNISLKTPPPPTENPTRESGGIFFPNKIIYKLGNIHLRGFPIAP